MMLNGGSKTCSGTGMVCPYFDSSFRDARKAQARNPYSRSWLWIPGSRRRRAPELRLLLNSQFLYLVRPARQRDVFGFHVEVERVVAAVAADAGRFHATERRS